MPECSGIFFIPAMKQKPVVVFFGTPEFAVASLQAILDAGYPVKGVVTAPDKTAGRGLKMKASPVKVLAESQHIAILQPEELTSSAFLQALKQWSPEIQVVVAFRILPEAVFKLAPKGTFNLHASLLPRYRGAAPINHAIMNGEKETGVSTFFLQEKVDTGNILLQEKIPIYPDETAGELHDRLMVLGAGSVVKTLDMITSGNTQPIAQDQIAVAGDLQKKAPKIRKEDCLIRWDRDVATVYNQIRGLSPSPGAYAEFTAPDGLKLLLKIFRSEMIPQNNDLAPGSVRSDGKTFFHVAARNGFIGLQQVQVAGRNVLTIAEFLHGFGRHFL